MAARFQAFGESKKWLTRRLLQGSMQKVDDLSCKPLLHGGQVNGSVAPLLLSFGVYQDPSQNTRSETLSLLGDFRVCNPSHEGAPCDENGTK